MAALFPTRITTVLYLFPDLRPLLSPFKRPVADNADLTRKIALLTSCRHLELYPRSRQRHPFGMLRILHPLIDRTLTRMPC